MVDNTYNTKNYTKQGGTVQIIGSGGTLEIESGGTLAVDAGGVFSIGGVTVTPTGTELNAATGLPASITTAATPATGTCGVQFVFKTAAGVAIDHAIAGLGFLSGSTGLAIAAATSEAVLTNGALTDLVAGKVFHFVTTAAGLLGVTVTAGAGTYYITFQLPNGKLVTSSALVVN